MYFGQSAGYADRYIHIDGALIVSIKLLDRYFTFPDERLLVPSRRKRQSSVHRQPRCRGASGIVFSLGPFRRCPVNDDIGRTFYIEVFCLLVEDYSRDDRQGQGGSCLHEVKAVVTRRPSPLVERTIRTAILAHQSDGPRRISADRNAFVSTRFSLRCGAVRPSILSRRTRILRSVIPARNQR